jgi:hypothetical protein
MYDSLYSDFQYAYSNGYKRNDYYRIVTFKCTFCNETSGTDEKVVYDGELCHKACYDKNVCANCSKLMESHKRVDKDGKVWHHRCYPYGNCDKCGLEVPPGNRIVDNGKVWHPQCVKYDKCEVCGKNVFNEQGIKSNGKIWHYRCVKCNKCGLKYKDGEPEFSFNGPKGNGIIHTKCGINVCRLCNMPYAKLPLTNTSLNDKVHTYCYGSLYPKPLVPSKCACGKNQLVLEKMWPADIWSIAMHKKFPYEFRLAVRTFILVVNRMPLPYRFPKDLLYMIIRMLVVPTEWPRWNTLTISTICLPIRCANDAICKKCDNLTRTVSTDISFCTTGGCNLYSYICKKCSIRVTYDAKPEDACNDYRCIQDRCKLCDGRIRYALDKQTELCAMYRCNVYYLDKCRCGSMVERAPTDPLNVCTSYRCIKLRCTECGSNIRPSSDYDGLCDSNLCIIRKTTLEKSISQLCNILGIDQKTYFETRSSNQKIAMLKSLVIERLEILSKDEISLIGLLMAAL